MRKSAKTILTPRALNERQRTRQGIAWILKAAEKGRKGGVPRDQRIAKEVLAVLEGQSEVFKWLEDVHKVGYLNRSVPFAPIARNSIKVLTVRQVKHECPLSLVASWIALCIFFSP